MANKIKNHSTQTLDQVKTIATALYAQFIARKMTISNLSKQTGLSPNSIKTIFRGETANIASFIAVGSVLGLHLGVCDLTAKTANPASNQVVGDGSPVSTFLR
jgi:DNA-binding phage protein